MRTLRTIPEVRYALHEARVAGRRVGLVPTMGGLHAGHAALMGAARRECDVAVVSLFVNPTQFAPGEDLGRYPRDEGADVDAARAAGVDLVFAPAVEEMYPQGFSTTVDPGPIGRTLEGVSRPGHFTGVATVVARLLGIVGPHAAFFGLKDYQQVQVVRRVARDLASPVEIRAVDTVREPDGLALSTRNRYLSPGERAAAPAIFRGLRAAADLHAAGERDPARLLGEARAAIETRPELAIDYLELRDAETLGPWTPDRAGVLLVAVHAGTTRLIDNVPLLDPTPRAGLARPIGSSFR